jgi:hypothetical protein
MLPGETALAERERGMHVPLVFYVIDCMIISTLHLDQNRDPFYDCQEDTNDCSYRERLLRCTVVTTAI